MKATISHGLEQCFIVFVMVTYHEAIKGQSCSSNGWATEEKLLIPRRIRSWVRFGRPERDRRSVKHPSQAWKQERRTSRSSWLRKRCPCLRSSWRQKHHHWTCTKGDHRRGRDHFCRWRRFRHRAQPPQTQLQRQHYSWGNHYLCPRRSVSIMHQE